jgi:carbonic anhydrase
MWAHWHLEGLAAEATLQPQEVPVDGELAVAAVLASTRAEYWRYAGSLTTPPCSEGAGAPMGILVAARVSHSACAGVRASLAASISANVLGFRA